MINYSSKLDKNEHVYVIYDVKLKRTVDGVESYIQPSDIKEGTKIKVKMQIPEGIDLTKLTKILHVHSSTDIEEIDFDASKVVDGYYEIEIDRLSEFAFIYKTNNGMSTGSIVAIVVCSIFLLLLIIYLLGYFFCYRRGHLDDNDIKVIYIFLPRGEYNKKASNE